MYKKLIIYSMIMALLEIVIGGIMIANILNTIKEANILGFLWIIAGLIKLIIIIKTNKKMSINLVNKLFFILSLITLCLLTTCWINPLTVIALIVYLPILVFYIIGKVMQNKI